MKVQISRTDLLKALQAVIGVVEKRQTMPILSNLLLRADKSGLTLVGTDLELELLTRVAANVKQEGAVTAPARKLFDICRGLPENADLKLDDSRARAVSPVFWPAPAGLLACWWRGGARAP